ncbi:hypothetical protein [Lactococcus cremoris]|uniref:hypothetical protein n=1 Tax=Lactococcus lactis subsp. cremoris TaxID=1359 RepID=UPI0020BFD493|nr:hypothetical protein [Lactococcus cremoris]
MQLQCENLNLELISEEVGAYSNTKRHSIVWYLRNAAKITDNVLEIGNNPFSEVDDDKANPILSFDGTETKLARIISICNSFKAEFRFKTELKDDGTLQNITLDLYQTGGVGQLRKDVTLYYGKNIDGITSTGDRTSTFFNSTTVTDSNNKYNWLSIEGKYYNSDGQLEFYKDAGSNTAYAPLSRDMFPSQILSTSSDQYTNKNIQISASSNDDLWDYAVSQFKLYAYPQMTYEVVVSVNAVTSALGNDKKLNIGDTIIVQDSTFDKSDGGLILSARVSEQEISFTNPLNNKITFTNFVKLKSEISADLYGRMKDLVDQNTPYRSELETTNGVQFKNSAGSTTLTARIYFGSDSTETKADSYSWTKDGTLVANVQEITVDASEIDGKAVYAYKATVNEKVVGTASVTITNVNDGENGTDGTDGRSVTGIEQKYQLTQTAEIPVNPWEDEVWLPSIPKMTATNKYLWSVTRTTFNQAPLTQDIVEQKAVYGDSGENGSDGNPGKVVSDTEPTTKFKGLTWKYSGVVDMTLGDGTKILAGTEYYWNGTVWALYEINAHNINGDNLSVTNGTFKDGKIESIWGGNGVNGTTTIEGRHLQIYSSDYTTNTENTIALDNLQGFAQVYTDHNIGRTITVQASFRGFFVSDSTGPEVSLTPQGLIQTSKKATVNFGYGRNVTLTRNGSYVTITSQNCYTIAPANRTWLRNVATLPLGYRPVEDVLIYNHDLSNGSKFSWSLLHPSGVIDLFSSGNIITTDYILSSSQIWITKDELPS